MGLYVSISPLLPFLYMADMIPVLEVTLMVPRFSQDS